MPDTFHQESIEQLLVDPRLMELCELQRTGDEVLDVVSLSETQHSAVLGWMFDPREGHGQGDEILRDMLMHASQAASQPTSLDGRSETAKFFGLWPPSRIRTTSFGSVFVARELGLKAQERVDLFIVDAQNKFILVIENKAGATHRDNQLKLYRESMAEVASANKKLGEYNCAYIAMDRYFDPEAQLPQVESKYWLHISYEWLEMSANRAVMHVARGNSAARLVVSYCNRQTDWESSESEKCSKLAAELTNVHPEAVKQMVSYSGARIEREWLSTRQGDTTLLFLLQNKGVLTLLRDASGLASVRAAVCARISALPKDNVRHMRAWLDVCPRGWEKYHGDDWWPVFLNVRYADPNKSKYTLAIIWKAAYARDATVADELRSKLEKIEPKFGLHRDSRWRRVPMKKSVNLEVLLDEIVRLEGKLAGLIDET